MQNEEAVSVIVPVYKVEAYLEACLMSIISQDYLETEIILIDDGSPDGCGAICDLYASRYPDIKVVHKENGGLGRARNSGLKVATGQYVVFIDSDDWIEENYVSELVQGIRNADMCICGYRRHLPDGRVKDVPAVEADCLLRKEDISAKAVLPIISSDWDKQKDIDRDMCVWTNIYKTEIIRKLQLEFASEREVISEDLCFNIDYMMHCDAIRMLRKCLYHYRETPASLTKTYRRDRFGKYLILLDAVEKRVNEYGLGNKSGFRLERFLIARGRKCICMTAKSNLPYRDKLKEIGNILSNHRLQEALRRYPVKTFKWDVRLFSVLMKYKRKVCVLILAAIRATR
jgi:glycosyltransferase involved in cell wall biosynthesis